MKFKTVNNIKEKGYPTSSKYYKEAHEEADVNEKKKAPKEYKQLKKIEKKMKPHTLMGTHSKSGKVTISKVVPKRLRNHVAVNHEIPELKAENRLKRKLK